MNNEMSENVKAYYFSKWINYEIIKIDHKRFELFFSISKRFKIRLRLFGYDLYLRIGYYSDF